MSSLRNSFNQSYDVKETKFFCYVLNKFSFLLKLNFHFAPLSLDSVFNFIFKQHYFQLF